MKKILGIFLLSIFLCGCHTFIGSPIQNTLWKEVEIGNKYTLTLKCKYTGKTRYYIIEQITKEKYKNVL